MQKLSVPEATNQIYNAFMRGKGLRHDQVKEIIEAALAGRTNGEKQVREIAERAICSLGSFDNGLQEHYTAELRKLDAKGG